MPFYEVPKIQWREFCSNFAALHNGAPVCIEHPDSPAGITLGLPDHADSRVLGHNVTLRDIMYSDHLPTGPQITVVIGDHHALREHIIPRPRTIQLIQPEEQNTGGLMLLQSSDGPSLVIHFAEAIIPGMLDGIQPPPQPNTWEPSHVHTSHPGY